MSDVRTETPAGAVRGSVCWNCGRRRPIAAADRDIITFSCEDCKSEISAVINAFFGWDEEEPRSRRHV